MSYSIFADFCRARQDNAIFANSTMLNASLLLSRALAAATETRQHQRVAKALMHVQYVMLLRWKGLRAYAQRTGTVWPLSESKQTEFDRFAATYNANTTTGLELRAQKGFRHFQFIVGSKGQTVMKLLPHCDLKCFHAEVFRN